MKKTVAMFCLLSLTVILGVDLFFYYKGGTENTISWFLYELSYEKPFVTFLTGFVCGHLFWNLVPPGKKNEADTKN